METEKKSYISVTALVMIIFLAVFGFGNIANNYKSIGLASVPLFSIGALLYFLPMALVIAEFGSYAKENSSGLHAWVLIGSGEKMAYYAIWTYFVGNIFYIPTLATRVPTYLHFAIYGSADMANVPLAIMGGVTLIVSLLLGVYFQQKFDKISTPVGYLSLILSAVFLVVAAYVFMAGHASVHLNSSDFMIHTSPESVLAKSLGDFAWIIFAYGGTELVGTYVNRVRKPERDFTKAVLLSAVMIGLLYVLGIICAAAFSSQEDFAKIPLVNAIIVCYQLMGDKIGLGPWFVHFVGLVQAIVTLVALVLWSVCLSEVTFSEVPAGTFPSWLTQKTSGGVMKNALIFQAVLCFIFLLITTVGGQAASELYDKIYNMSTIAVVIPYLLIAWAYVQFRAKGLKGAFSVSKGNGLPYLLGGLIVILAVVAIIFCGYDFSQPLAGQMSTIYLYYGGLVFFIVIGVVLRRFRFK